MPVPHRRAAVLAVGDELILGQKIDTNSAWISDRLAGFGVLTTRHVTVRDEVQAQIEAFKQLSAGNDIVVCTGGLGPTADDLTREALAAAADDRLVRDDGALAAIRSWFARRGRDMPVINEAQALRPSRALCLPNHHGTAPGIAAAIGECDVFCLPGPPAEMKPMFDAEVAPKIRTDPVRAVRTRALHLFGIGESDAATRLGPLMERGRNPLVGTTASGGVVSVRIRSDSDRGPDVAAAAITEAEAEVRRAVGEYVFGADAQTQAGALVDALRERSMTLAVAESCTGGLLGAMITDVAGASDVFRGGWMVYANELKTSLLGVDAATFAPGGDGAVSDRSARALAAGAAERAPADAALSITGIAGPGGGSDQKPVGTVWIGLALRGTLGMEVEARRFLMAGDRRSIREWSARTAIGMFWMRLNGRGDLPLLREQERA